MRKEHWKKLALALLAGSILLQAPACTDTAIYLSTAASLVTAGGVIYLVWRVVD